MEASVNLTLLGMCHAFHFYGIQRVQIECVFDLYNDVM